MSRKIEREMEERRVRLLRYLLGMSEGGRPVTVSRRTMEQDLGLTELELRADLRALAERSLVEVSPRRGPDGGQVASAYRVTERGSALAAPSSPRPESGENGSESVRPREAGLNYGHVRVFVDAYEAGSISGAARVEGVSVANASKAVITLEERLDARLFVRTGQGVEPTPFGDAFYRKASTAVRAFGECEDLARRLGSVRAAAGKAAGA